MPTRRTPVTAPAPVAQPDAVAVAKSERANKKEARRRVKLVRDSFTLPADDFALIAAMKSRALRAKCETKKSELIRAGLRALSALDDKALLAALQALTPVKVGRPLKGQ